MAVRSPSLIISSWPSSVFCCRVAFLTVNCRLLVATILAPEVPLNESLTCARTSFSPHNYCWAMSMRCSPVGRVSTTYLWIMNEGTAFAVGRQLASRGILETFDDGLGGPISCGFITYPKKGVSNRFPRAIVTDDQRQRGMKLYGLASGVIKRPNTIRCRSVSSR